MKGLLSVWAVAMSAWLLSTTSASAQTFTADAALLGSEETPAPGLLTGAVGTAEVSVDASAREVAVTLRVFNITATTAGHIHVGPRGVAGPVVINFPGIAGRTGDFTTSFRLGVAAFVARPEIGINTIDDAIQAIAGGNAYVNIHTTANPGGEIRGQLTVRQ